MTEPYFSFLCLFCVIVYFVMDTFAFVVLDLVFSAKLRDWLEECLQSDLFCVRWDIRLLTQSIIDVRFSH